MDPVSCLYNFLSIGILCYFVIICFLIKKCCMNCGTNCASDDENLCKCYQKIYEGEITPSNHVIVREGNERLPISYLLNQQDDNEGEYVLGEDGILYRNEACRECCLGDDVSRTSCNSHEDVFVIRATRGKGECSPCSPSALGLGEGSFRRTASGRSVPTGLSAANSAYAAGSAVPSAYAAGSAVPSSHASGAFGGTTRDGTTRDGTAIQGAKGSPQNISDVSELKGVINYGGHPPTSKRVSQGVEFHTKLSEHVFIVEGSIGSSEASQSIAKASATSNASRGTRGSHESAGSCGSPDSRTSRTSCGSRVSKKSGAGSISSKKSCVSTCPSAKSSKSSPTLASGGALAAKIGSPTSRSGSACSELGKPCPSSGSMKQSMKSGMQGPGVAGYELNADGTSVYGKNADQASIYGAKSDGASVRGALPDGTSLYSAKSAGFRPDAASLYSTKSGGAKSDGTSVYGGSMYGTNSFGPGGQGMFGPGRDTDSYGTNISGAVSYGTRRGLDGDLSGDESPTSGGISKSGKSGKSGKYGAGGSPGDPNQPATSFPCVSPCGTKGARPVVKAKSSTFQGLPCGSPGSPCPFKNKSGQSSSSSSPRKPDGKPDGRDRSSSVPRKVEYARDASPASSRKGCSRGGSPGGGRRSSSCSASGGGAGSPYSRKDLSGSQTPISPLSPSEGASPYSTGGITPASSPSSPYPKQGAKCTSDICSSSSGIPNKKAVEKSPSPILKNPDDSPSPPRDGMTSPRVSIKEKFDIITPDGITSAPTFGKDQCKPCPFLNESDVSSGAGETGSYASNRRNDVLSDEYKDNISNKRKADKISADYKDSAADYSRGTKSARFSDRCNSGTCSSRVSSTKSCSKCSKGTKSWPSTSTAVSSVATPTFSTTKCSKCSSATRASSLTSTSTTTKQKPSGTNSLCETTCKTKSAANNTASVTTADIDDFRTISPDRSRCENLGSALARSSCGEIRKARSEATCEALKDPSKDVICNSAGLNAECSAIKQLMENPNCPSILEIIKVVDQMGEAGNLLDPASSGYGQGGNDRSRPGASSTVDAAVIHEISTKVQSCLQHARAIAAKVGGGSSECRKTMRVQATARGQSTSVKVNSNMTLNTKGITINQYNKVDKPFGKNPGIQVKMKNKTGNVEQFKKPYAELMTADGGVINIRIRSPCRSTPGKLLCVSTTNNPCCSDSTTNNTTTSTQPTTSSQGRTGNKVTYEDETSEDENNRRQPSSQEYSSQDDPDNKGAVVVYKREANQKSSKSKEKSTKGECSPECSSCKKKTCPNSKYYKGRKKQGKMQVYNVTTSHFSQLSHNFRSPYIKGMPVVDARLYEQYTHPERYRAGETYLKRRREMIQKIKGKCPWL